VIRYTGESRYRAKKKLKVLSCSISSKYCSISFNSSPGVTWDQLNQNSCIGRTRWDRGHGYSRGQAKPTNLVSRPKIYLWLGFLQILVPIRKIRFYRHFLQYSHDKLRMPNFSVQKLQHLGDKTLHKTCNQLRTASKCIMAVLEALRWPFCFRTAHCAAFPVSPIRYADIHLHERLMKRLITSTGHALSAFSAASLASLNVFLLTCRYRYLAHPQYCRI
jgi:hypothetical protein